jgi:hypothetical protein
MAKFYGIIGFAVSEETRPGVWTESVKERTYRGDLARTASRWEGTETLNDNVNITNQISIVADPFAYEHFSAIRYIKFLGAYWKVNNIDISYPRLKLTVGGVYNGPTA